MESGQNGSGLSSRRSPRLKNLEHKSQITECESSKEKGDVPVTPAKNSPSALKEKASSTQRKSRTGPNSSGKTSHSADGKSSKGKADVLKTPVKKSISTHCQEAGSEKTKGGRYPLRSSLNGARLLRSKINNVSMSLPASTTQPVNLVKVKRKRKQKAKDQTKDEYTRIGKHVRYLLQRIKYEQSLIDAYASDGWKGLSLEKIRPEKELLRAKTEIVRCKLRIRCQFEHLEALLAEGKLDDSLFDSEGEIDSEDIICAKCGSKNLGKDNDIILCDGICDRGFHQKCLTPPLLNEDIPPGDEGWLCPGCDCKLDCVDSINELLGTDLSIGDAWENVFPEAAVSAARDKQFDDLGLPSDDSEDDNYSPDANEDGEEDKDDGDDNDSSSSEESFTSEDMVVPNGDVHTESLRLPSDDSEDNDYDPDRTNLEVQSEMDRSCSDESDFTSDTDDLTNGFCDSIEDLTSPQNQLNFSVHSNKDGRTRKEDCKSSENAELFSPLEPDLGQDIAIVSEKRQCERLDYKKLYDEAYGNGSSDSSEDDEDYSENPEEGKNISKGKCSSMLPSESGGRRNLRDMKGKCTGSGQSAIRRQEFSMKTYINISKEVINSGPECAAKQRDYRKSSLRGIKPKEMILVNANVPDKDLAHVGSNGSKKSYSAARFFGSSVSQKLHESFDENQYPSREEKVRLASELGLTLKQVDKWFGNARHSFRVLNKDSSQGVRSPGSRSTATVPDTLISSISPGKPTQTTSENTRSITDGTSILISSQVKSPKITPDNSRSSITPNRNDLPTKSIEHDKGSVNSRNLSNSELQSPRNGAVSTLMVVGTKEETLESPIQNFDRQQLVLRELRKRRRYN